MPTRPSDRARKDRQQRETYRLMLADQNARAAEAATPKPVKPA